MSRSKLNKYIAVAMDEIGDITATTKHVSIIIKRNRILAIGINQSHKTHPLAKRYQYRFSASHSELNAVLKVNKSQLKGATLINIRLSGVSLKTKTPILRNSKPCEKCLKWLKESGISHIYYTKDDGFHRLF